MSDLHKEDGKPTGIFRYEGKQYRVATPDQITIEIPRAKLPNELYRVVDPGTLKFDEKEMLRPANAEVTNDMVSTTTRDDWEAVARIFHPGKPFSLLHIQTSRLVGPTFLAGSKALQEGEYLVLVPRYAIVNVLDFTWEQAEANYDYGISRLDTENQRFYQGLITRSIGMKPVRLSNRG